MASHNDHLYALDLASGQRVWEKDAGSNVLDLSISETELVAATAGNKLLALKPGDGMTIWERPNRAAITPNPRGSLVLPSYSAFGVMIGKGDKVYVPEDVSIYKTTLVIPHDGGGNADRLYVADRRSVLAVRKSDGRTLWSAPCKHPRVLAAVGEYVVAADERDVIHCFRASDGTSVWNRDAVDPVFQMERLGETLLATLYGGHLLALSMEDGRVLARLEIRNPSRLVREVGERVILCSETGTWIFAPAAVSPGK